MSVAGIICEYNPFHNGHAYQIRQLKEAFGMEAVVCAMDGHFLQRGEPALVHKMARVQMALSAGADLVLELPALYATRSAYWFALGGLSLLSGTGVVTHLAFGSETTDLTALQKTARYLASPSPAFKEALKIHLSSGASFVAAQAAALEDLIAKERCDGASVEPASPPLIPHLPNDRLGLSYLQVIAEKGYPLEPILVPRKGDAYHQTVPTPGTALASATSIRRLLRKATPDHGLLHGQGMPESAGIYLPHESFRILQQYPYRLVFSEDLDPILLHILRRSSPEEIRRLPDMTEGLENRIIECARTAVSMVSFYEMLKTRRYAMTRLQRAMTHLYLNYTVDQARWLSQGTPYLRVLGCTAKGRELLQKMKTESRLPVITRAGQLNRICLEDAHARSAWELEIRCGQLYALLQNPEGKLPAPLAEHQLKPIFLP